MNNQPECKGCNYVIDERCSLRNLTESKDCPCQNCLIKAICTKHCKERTEIYTNAMWGSLGRKKGVRNHI